MANSVIGALRVTLGLDSAEFTRGTKKAQAQMTGFQKSMATVGAGVKAAFVGIIGGQLLSAFTEGTRRGLEFGSAILESAEKIGVAAKSLQEYRYAASQVGIEQDAMDNALSKGTKILGEAAAGAKRPAEMYRKLGIDIRDANGQVRNFGDLLPEIAQAISGLPSEAEKARVATVLLGKAGQEAMPLLNLGADGVKNLKMEAQELGLVLSDIDLAALDKAADNIGKLDRQLAAQEARFTAENINQIYKYNEAVGQLKLFAMGAVAWIVEMGDGIGYTGKMVVSEFAKMATNAVASVQRLYTGVKTWVLDKLGAVWDGVKAKVESVKSMFFGLYDAVVGHSYIPDMVDGIRDEMNRLDKVMVDPAEKATKKTAEAHRQMAADIKQTLDGLFPELAALADYNDQLSKIGKSGLDDTGKLAAKRRLFAQFEGRFEPKDQMPQTVIPDNEDDLFDSAEKQVADYLEVWDDGVRRTEKMNARFTDSFADMARDVNGYFGNLVKSIKDGDFFSIVDSVLGLLNSIGNATGGFKIGGMQFGQPAGASSKPPGFASGGSMRLGGFSGIDRNMLSMNGQPLARVSRGETMHIRPENDSGGSAARGLRVQVIENERYWVTVRETAGRVVDARSPAIAAAGARLANGQSRYRQSRALD